MLNDLQKRNEIKEVLFIKNFFTLIRRYKNAIGSSKSLKIKNIF